ncbi:hypothetical protein H7170_03020 [Candidatus Gracilibacteria bacterium]|nr:hypothetical protein [Candidatus Gracilibacteria bacterium]
MNQNPKPLTEYPILSKAHEHIPQASFYINALREKYATYQTVLDRLDIIASKIKQVPTHIQNTVTELLRADLENKVINTSIMTSAIMAINPKNIILATTVINTTTPKFPEAANDTEYQLAA